jgi:spore coat protein CotH
LPVRALQEMNKCSIPCFVLLALFVTTVSAQDFYDLDSIPEVKLTFFQSNWDAKLDSLKAANEEVYLLAKSVEINGEIFDSVGVKYKGNSTYSANNQKNPMHIELDYIKNGAKYQGYADVKLGNGVADPTFVREALSYEILQQYMVCPRANFAKLWINGTYWGLYSNQEGINKKFIKDHFYTDGKNPFFKCNPLGGAGPGSNANPDLVYSTSDSTTYMTRYEMKSDYGWKQLVWLMDTLKNQSAYIDRVLDVDRALWMLAFNDVLVNLDSYTGAFAQNYYLYYDENGRWIPIVWDLNMSFGGFTSLGFGGAGGGGLSITQMQQMDPLVQSTNTSRPLIQKLLAIPTYKKQYLAHLRTILNENFGNTDYRTRALEMQATIDAAVQADTKKFYTYTNFINNIDQTVTSSGGGPGGGSLPGITLLMNARNTFLNSNANVAAVAPAISNILTDPLVPIPGQEVWITATITDVVSVLLGHRANTWEIFQKTTMYDDGVHHDGAAGDGVFGTSIIADAAENQYYIYAENTNAGRFSPERAEFEFHTIVTNLPAPTAVGEVVINEILADNIAGLTDEFGEQEDWVEMYNRTDNMYDLEGLSLTDNPDKFNKWEFPHGSVIAPHSYLVVWLDEDGSQGDLHANFKLSKSGEFLMLADLNGLVFDSLTFSEQVSDISFGRYPNGTGNFTSMPTTFGAVNSLTSGTTVLTADHLMQISPNPAGDYLHISAPGAIGDIRIVNALGQVAMQVNTNSERAAILPVYSLPSGLYWLVTAKTGAVAFVKR